MAQTCMTERPGPRPGETCGACSLLYILGFGLYACPVTVAERTRLTSVLVRRPAVTRCRRR